MSDIVSERIPDLISLKMFSRVLERLRQSLFDCEGIPDCREILNDFCPPTCWTKSWGMYARKKKDCPEFGVFRIRFGGVKRGTRTFRNRACSY